MSRKRKHVDRNPTRCFFGHQKPQSCTSSVYNSKDNLVGINLQACKSLSAGVAKVIKRKPNVPSARSSDCLSDQNIVNIQNARVDKVRYARCNDIGGSQGNAYKLRVRCDGKWFTVGQLIRTRFLSGREWQCCKEPISLEMCQMGVCKLLAHFKLPISEGVRAAGDSAASKMGVLPIQKKKAANVKPQIRDAFATRMLKARAKKKNAIPKILNGDVPFDEFVKNVPKSNGHKYEAMLLRFFRALGMNARRLPKVADHGVDIIVRDSKRKVAIQCKFYGEASVGNVAVQQTFAGMHFHGCDEGWIVTNSRYTSGAAVEAKKLGIRLLNHDTFPQQLSKCFNLLTPTGRIKKRRTNG